MDKVKSWVNGKPDKLLSNTDRGLHFGDGLFETMLIRAEHIQFYSYHWRRLQLGLSRLKLDFDEKTFLADIQLAFDFLKCSSFNVHQHWRLKYIVSRGDNTSGYAVDDAQSVTRIMLLQPFDRDVSSLQCSGVKARFCQWRLSTQSGLAGIKHLNRLDQVMARSEWSEVDIFEGLMADQQGRWLEGTMSNLFVVTAEQKLLTPPLVEAGVHGTIRQVILDEICPEIGVQYQQVYLPDFSEVEEVFITNALMGIVPVISLAHHVFSVGPITRQLQRQLSLQC